jgi:hypothetical protein
MLEFGSLDVRPHKLMLIVSKIGEGCTRDLGDAELTRILRVSRENPSLPITLRCPVTTNYTYQNPDDTQALHLNTLFYARCDLKIIQKMGMVPGDTRPAVEIFHRLLHGVETARGILYFDEVTSETWRGFDREMCHYDKGRAMGLKAIIPPRDHEERVQFKVDSVKKMYEMGTLKIRPHHLMCICCFFGGRELVPVEEDNLFEAIDIIRAKPDFPIELVCGPCIICPPCHNYFPSFGRCVSPDGMALRDELKDLDVLQILGLKYGDVLSARELYKRLFEKVQSTTQICGYGDGIERCPEFRVCGSIKGSVDYSKARSVGLDIFEPPKDA